jgi:uncharacterized protein (TIGR02270 family)
MHYRRRDRLGIANLAAATQPLNHIVQQYADEVATLHVARNRLVSSAGIALEALSRFDNRIAAHLDGLAVAGKDGFDACDALMEEPSAEAVFTCAVAALEAGETARLQRLIARLEDEIPPRDGLVAAFGWVGRDRLRGVVADLLHSPEAWRRSAAIAACAMHGVDPGLATWTSDPDPNLRARVFRAAGELGKREFVSAIAKSVLDEDAECRFWSSWSAVLLGDRREALDSVISTAFESDTYGSMALQLGLQTLDVDGGHSLLRSRAEDKEHVRQVIKGAGFIGDARYVPWLIGHMADDKLARLAGECFSVITGLDLSQPPFFRQQPEDFESGPNDEPEDDNVEMDEDGDLPWPEQAKVQAWWDQHGARFTTGIRHFVGAPPSRVHCIHVLKNGYQRQRIAAAYHLCLLDPGTPLFEWRAPAWRQQRELAQMT